MSSNPPVQNAPRVPQQQGQQQQQQGTGFSRMLPMLLINAFLMYNLWNRQSSSTTKTTQETNIDPDGKEILKSNHFNLWKENVNYNIRIYLSEDNDLESSINNNNTFLWESNLLKYTSDVSSQYFETNFTINLTQTLQNNG